MALGRRFVGVVPACAAGPGRATKPLIIARHVSVGSGAGRAVVDVSEELIRGLKKKAVTLRKHIIRMTHNAQSGHPGGSMAACDIVTALYFQVLRVDPKNPTWPDRDRAVMKSASSSGRAV